MAALDRMGTQLDTVVALLGASLRLPGSPEEAAPRKGRKAV